MDPNFPISGSLNLHSPYFLIYLYIFFGILNLGFFPNSAHCGLKVSRSQAKIDENFANYFLKTKANNKCFFNVHVKGHRKL